MAIIIDGKAIAKEVRCEAAARCALLKEHGVTPALAVILVGEDAASVSYVKGKRKALAEAGMADRSILLAKETSEGELLSVIQKLNMDITVHGILVQLPLPPHISEEKIICAIDPKKDVDGFHPVNAGRLVTGQKAFLPCTPHGIVVLLKKAGVVTNGAHAVIIGRSNIVGKPLALLMMRRDVNATVTVCHTGTRNLPSITRQADILIAAAGKASMVTADMVKEGATVIDVGVNRVPLPRASGSSQTNGANSVTLDGGETSVASGGGGDTGGPDATKKKGYRLCGDVDFDAVEKKASVITPVPGGVGPMTIAMLMINTIEAAEAAASKA